VAYFSQQPARIIPPSYCKAQDLIAKKINKFRTPAAPFLVVTSGEQNGVLIGTQFA
jgi:hypothetical protein